MTVYIFTDGVWCQRSRRDMNNLMTTVEATLLNTDAKPSQLGIQFIQFGGGVEESQELQRLCASTRRYVRFPASPPFPFSANNYRKIFDVEPYDDGNIWKIILGATDHWNRW
jgi:hypothetical protein